MALLRAWSVLDQVQTRTLRRDAGIKFVRTELVTTTNFRLCNGEWDKGVSKTGRALASGFRFFPGKRTIVQASR